MRRNSTAASQSASALFPSLSSVPWHGGGERFLALQRPGVKPPHRPPSFRAKEGAALLSHRASRGSLRSSVLLGRRYLSLRDGRAPVGRSSRRDPPPRRARSATAPKAVRGRGGSARPQTHAGTAAEWSGIGRVGAPQPVRRGLHLPPPHPAVHRVATEQGARQHPQLHGVPVRRRTDGARACSCWNPWMNDVDEMGVQYVVLGMGAVGSIDTSRTGILDEHQFSIPLNLISSRVLNMNPG